MYILKFLCTKSPVFFKELFKVSISLRTYLDSLQLDEASLSHHLQPAVYCSKTGTALPTAVIPHSVMPNPWSCEVLGHPAEPSQQGLCFTQLLYCSFPSNRSYHEGFGRCVMSDCQHDCDWPWNSPGATRWESDLHVMKCGLYNELCVLACKTLQLFISVDKFQTDAAPWDVVLAHKCIPPDNIPPRDTTAWWLLPQSQLISLKATRGKKGQQRGSIQWASLPSMPDFPTRPSRVEVKPAVKLVTVVVDAFHLEQVPGSNKIHVK